MSTELQIALALLQGLVTILLAVVWKLRDADRRALTREIEDVADKSRKADAKAEKAQQMAVENLQRIHDQEVRSVERFGKVAELERAVELQFSQQNTQLDRIEHTLGNKVSRGELKASVRRDPRSDPESDPPPDPLPPMRPPLPSVRRMGR